MAQTLLHFCSTQYMDFYTNHLPNTRQKKCLSRSNLCRWIVCYPQESSLVSPGQPLLAAQEQSGWHFNTQIIDGSIPSTGKNVKLSLSACALIITLSREMGMMGHKLVFLLFKQDLAECKWSLWNSLISWLFFPFLSPWIWVWNLRWSLFLLDFIYWENYI